jgi:hypothetical protein
MCERLVKIGVDSLKIEGRTKSQYYVTRTAQTYRRAIDDAVAGRPFNPELITELEGLSNRGYTAASWSAARPGLPELRNRQLRGHAQPVCRRGQVHEGRLGRGGNQEPLRRGRHAGDHPPQRQPHGACWNR